jgi:hypothetical protein
MHPAMHVMQTIAVRVNAAEVESLLLMGWRLTDEPDCSGARMLPPRHVSVNRVIYRNENIAPPVKENARPRWRREPGKETIDNGSNRPGRKRTQ